MHSRLVLLGGGNALGRALIRLGAEEDIGFVAPKPSTHTWDVAGLKDVIEQVKPDVVINLAYYYDWFQAGTIDCDVFPEQEQVVAQLAKLCAANNCTLLQPSSYRVFDGLRTTAYSETDECKPLSERGKALLRMEQSIRELCPQHIILRFGWLLDDSHSSLLGRVLQRAQEHIALELADDRRGNPTPIDDAARVMLAIIKQLDCAASLWGTYHYGAQEAATSLSVGQAILSEAKFWVPSISQEIDARGHASFTDAIIEPQHGVLDCRKITYTFGIKPRSWRASMSDLLHSYYRSVN